MMPQELAGKFYVASDGSIQPDEGGIAIYRKLQGMLMLLTKHDRMPYFFVDPVDESYWEFTEYEDGQLTLREVTREYIEKSWPETDFEKRIVVDRPVKY